MNNKQFRILIQMMGAIRLTLKGFYDDADKAADKAIEDAESLENSEYFPSAPLNQSGKEE